MEPEVSLPYLQGSGIGPYPEPDESNLTLSPYPRLDLSCFLFLSGFSTKISYSVLISPMHATCPAPRRSIIPVVQ
jgi:hypothetical protein